MYARAAVVAETREWLGTPFHHQGRVKGAGVDCTPRIRRRRADGSPDPSDIVGPYSEICDRCGGAGEVRAELPSPVERGPGYAADLT